jgi:hypothetical protein
MGSSAPWQGGIEDPVLLCAQHSTDAFEAIVLDGTLASNGRVSYRNSLSIEDAEAIRAYLITEAQAAKAQVAAPADRPKTQPQRMRN